MARRACGTAGAIRPFQPRLAWRHTLGTLVSAPFPPAGETPDQGAAMETNLGYRNVICQGEFTDNRIIRDQWLENAVAAQ